MDMPDVCVLLFSHLIIGAHIYSAHAVYEDEDWKRTRTIEINGVQ